MEHASCSKRAANRRGLGTVIACLLVGLTTSPAHAGINTLQSFDGTNGSEPQSLLLASDGNIYGVTNSGGATNNGTVFRMTPAGVLTTLAEFDGANGSGPNGTGLIEGLDGNFYGDTYFGGAYGQGVVYRMTPDGTLTVLMSFDGGPSGAHPIGDMMRASDGSIYGETNLGGTGCGTIFKITPATGSVTSMATLDGTSGCLPWSRLLEGPDGNFYSMAINGGNSGAGTIFRMTPDGVLTQLVSFNGSNGTNPAGGLTDGEDGFFYGTAANGGDFGLGTFFKVTPSGELTTLLSFSGPNGAHPLAGVIRRSDGYFYGVTFEGGTNNLGTLFRVDGSGVLETLASFDGANGQTPARIIAVGPQEVLYGTTLGGGAAGRGTIYKFAQAALSWISPPTPPDGADFNLTITQPFAQALRAEDLGGAGGVHISASSPLPAGANIHSFDGSPANATVEWTPATGQAGDYVVNFKAQSTADPTAPSISRSLRLHVRKRPTSITAAPEILQLSPLAVHLRMKATVRAQSPTQPLAGAKVVFSSPSGNVLCTAVSDSLGVAACGTVVTYVRTTLNLGYVASFAGDGTYAGSTAQGALIQ